MKKLMVSAIFFALAGCTALSPAERSAQMQKEVEEMIQVYGPACEKLGFQPDSNQWRECILNLNTSKTLENYRTRSTTIQCFGHRGFSQCSSF